MARTAAPLFALALALALAGVASPSASWARPARTPLVQSMDVRIPLAPTPVRIAGQRVLAYELHLTNFTAADIALTRVEIADGGRRTRLADYHDSDLAGRLGRPRRPGVTSARVDPRVIGSGTAAVLHVWLALGDGAATPARLRHRIEFDSIGRSGRQHGVVDGAVVDVRAQPPVRLDAPLRGGPWVALYDPSMAGGHRTSIYTIDGRARIPARFAIDLVKLERDGSTARGDRSRVASWHGYGADVLAVADAVVADARDDIPDAETIGASRGPVAIENASGNYLALDLGGGRHAFYEHLKHGSIRVRRGDRVRRGQVIARLGNTGSSSSGPHLHFHVSDASATLAAEGVPYELSSFEVVGAFDSIATAASGKRWGPPARRARGVRRMELPAPNTVLMFADDRDRAPRP